MTCYFVIVGHNDNPLFELDVKDTGKLDDKRQMAQFVAHASLDLVDEAKWETTNLFLKSVDRFNELSVAGFVTASHMRFLLVYDGPKAQENMKNFFLDMYDAFVKALLNPFYIPNSPITSQNFRKKAQAIAKKYL